MRSIALPLLAFLPASLLIACGPSEAELKSAQNLDQAVRQLNTVCDDFIQGISNEGQLTRVDMSDYYSGYVERIQTINQDLAGKTLVDDYRNFRARFDSVSRESNRLIQAREEYISKVVDMANALEEFSDKVSRAEESEYNTFEYLSEAYVKEREFKRVKESLTHSKADCGAEVKLWRNWSAAITKASLRRQLRTQSDTALRSTVCQISSGRHRS